MGDNNEVNIDFAFLARQFPQSGCFSTGRSSACFAAGIDDASDDHRQSNSCTQCFFARVKSPVQSKFLGQFQQCIAGPIRPWRPAIWKSSAEFPLRDDIAAAKAACNSLKLL